MWHEARKTEKQVFKLFDTSAKKKEIARRIQEQNAREPQESLVVHGHRMRIYDDAEQDFRGSTTLTKWQGDESTLIDRFDVRNFLETIPKKSTSVEEGPKTAEEFIEQMQIEYERYKELVAVEFTGDDEERVLKNMEEKEQKKMLARLSKYRHKKQSKPAKKAAIGFTYDDDQEETQEKNEQDDSETKKASFSKPASDSESSDDEEEELFSARLGSIIFSSNDWERLNKIGEKYHLPKDSFDKLYDVDRGDELDTAKINEIERERLSISGRGGKRARARLQIRKRLILKDPLNEDAVACLKRFAERRMKTESTEEDESSDESEFEEKVEFITSFGGEEDAPKKSKTKIKTKILPIKETQKVEDSNDHKRLAQLKSRRSESPFGGSSWSMPSPKKKEPEIVLASTRRSKSPRRRSRSRSPKRNKRKKSSTPEEVPKKKTSSGWLHARLKNLKKEKEEPSKSKVSSESEDNSEDDKELKIRSSMSESEKERIEIENRKRRIRRTKRLLKKKSQRSESEDSENEKKSAAAQKLRVELQKNLTRTKRELLHEEMEKRAKQEEDDKHRNDSEYVSRKYSSRRTPTPNRNRSSSSTSSNDSSRYRRRRRSRSRQSRSRSPAHSRSRNRRRSRSRSRNRDRRSYRR